MPDIPHEMKRNQRPRIDDFDPEEYLFRRVSPDNWSEDGVELDAIELPDMSVNRSSLGPPRWARLADDLCEDWAVVGFKVKDIPQELLHNGIDKYNFMPKHIPLDENYPHSEVRCYKNDNYLNAKRDLDRELHQRWREKLSWKIRTFLRPGGESEND